MGGGTGSGGGNKNMEKNLGLPVGTGLPCPVYSRTLRAQSVNTTQLKFCSVEQQFEMEIRDMRDFIEFATSWNRK